MDLTQYNDIDVLLEDTSVKFGSKPYPKDGWAVFLVGGPGSGKSSTGIDRLLINAKIIDNDDINESYLRLLKAIYNSKDTPQEVKLTIYKKYGNVNSLRLDSSAYNIEFAQKVNEDKQFMRKMIDLYAKSNQDSLSNIIIDSTGNDREALVSTAKRLKSVGYKLSIVWIVTSVAEAIDRNTRRARKVNSEYLVKIHHSLLTTIPTLFKDKNIVELFNEAWIVFGENVSNFSKKFSEKYANTAFKLDKENGAFRIPADMKDRIVKEVGIDNVSNGESISTSKKEKK